MDDIASAVRSLIRIPGHERVSWSDRSSTQPDWMNGATRPTFQKKVLLSALAFPAPSHVRVESESKGSREDPDWVYNLCTRDCSGSELGTGPNGEAGALCTDHTGERGRSELGQRSW